MRLGFDRTASTRGVRQAGAAMAGVVRAVVARDQVGAGIHLR